MQTYLDLLRDVLENGTERGDRTGTGTLSVFGRQMRFDLSGWTLPAVTTKRLHFKSIIHELLWFLKGSTNIKYLQENGVRIWDAWADENGDLGPVYGKQWRRWRGAKWANHAQPQQHLEVAHYLAKPFKVDQVAEVIDSIKNNPLSRRHIVSAWNVADVPDMALPPCHLLYQFYVREGKFLDCMMYQRSCDMFLGVPFNIVSYSLLTMMIAHVCGLKPGEFVHTLGDAHIYLNHLDQVKTQLERKPLPLPTVLLHPGVMNIDSFSYETIKIIDYQSHPGIKAPISV